MTDLWMELARRVTTSEREHDAAADREWRTFPDGGDLARAAYLRGVAKGLAVARDHQLDIAAESRDGTVSASQDALDAACHSAYLHIKWKYVTKQMTTEEKEAFADACDRAAEHAAREDGNKPHLVPRWWRDDYTGPTEGL